MQVAVKWLGRKLGDVGGGEVATKEAGRCSWR